MFHNPITYLFIGLIIAAVVSIPWPQLNKRNDFDDGPGKPMHPGPAINLYVKDERWLEGYKAHIAHNAAPGSLTDEMVMQAVNDIVNGEGLSKVAQYHMLDALQMQVGNAHPRGMAADVIDTINDEMNALDDPNWHGRYGTFTSMRR